MICIILILAIFCHGPNHKSMNQWIKNFTISWNDKEQFLTMLRTHNKIDYKSKLLIWSEKKVARFITKSYWLDQKKVLQNSLQKLTDLIRKKGYKTDYKKLLTWSQKKLQNWLQKVTDLIRKKCYISSSSSDPVTSDASISRRRVVLISSAISGIAMNLRAW